MRGLLKILAGIFAAVLLLLLAAGVAFYVLIDPRDYREFIETAVREQTGRELRIDGDIGLRFVPCCGMTAASLSIANPPGFPGDTFARLESAGVDVMLLPLLMRREVIIGAVRLDGLKLDLVQRADGAGNWSFGEAVARESDDEPVSPAGGDAAPITAFSLAGITLTDAAAGWRDLAAGSHYRVDNLQLETGAIRNGEPFELEVSMSVQDIVAGTAGTLDLRGRVSPDLDGLRATANDLVLRLSSGGIDAHVRADAEVSGEVFAASGRIDIPEFSPRTVLERAGALPETADPQALGSASLSAGIKLDGDALRLQDIDATLDQSRLQGSAAVENFARPAVRFDLALDLIDIDRYLAPAPGDGEPTAESGATDEELPVETLRALRADGRARIGKLIVNGLELSDAELQLSAADGRIGVAPAKAVFYGGTIDGAARIIAAGNRVDLSLRQSFNNVAFAALLTDLAETDQLDGRVRASLDASAGGTTSRALLESLTGTLDFDLADGVFRGTDIWHEISRARALIRRKPPPPAPRAPETRIDTLKADGRIANGRISSEAIAAGLPFLRMNGRGSFDWRTEKLRYRFDARVVEAPELEGGEVLADLTGLVIPIQVRGTLDEPEVKVELGDLAKDVARDRITEKLSEKLLEKLNGDEPQDEEPDGQSSGDRLRESLRDLLRR